MADDKTENLKMHPLIRAQEQSGESTIEFRGFLGTADDETLRLYADLNMSAYVDIPKEGLVYVEQDSGGEAGTVRAFVRPDQKVREVTRRTVAAAASALSATAFPPTDRFPRPERGGLIGCYNRCEAVFASRAADILQQRSRALLICNQYGMGSLQCQQANAEALDAEQRAVGALHECILQCRASQPYHSPLWTPVGEIVTGIVTRYLG